MTIPEMPPAIGKAGKRMNREPGDLPKTWCLAFGGKVTMHYASLIPASQKAGLLFPFHAGNTLRWEREM